jgi:hypothetical protein
MNTKKKMKISVPDYSRRWIWKVLVCMFMTDVTGILNANEQGDAGTTDKLLPLINTGESCFLSFTDSLWFWVANP